MLTLLAVPSCCCLKTKDAKQSTKEEASCCTSVEAELPASKSTRIPAEGMPDPCDCEMTASQTLGLPEKSILIVENTMPDFSTDWVEIQALSDVDNGERVDSSAKSHLSVIHPPGLRSCQVYCVYRI